MEIWRDIKGYEGLYQVSNEGRVRSLDRTTFANSRWGKVRIMKFKGRIIKQFVGRNGYIKVSLCKNGNNHSKDVHRLVYEAFVEEIPKAMQVNHIDENKLNNTVNNLNLMTPKENVNWGTAIERMKKTKRLHNM